MASASISSPVIDHPEHYTSFGMDRLIRQNYHRHHHSHQTIRMNPPTSVASLHARSLSLAQPAIPNPTQVSPPFLPSASWRRKIPTPTNHRVGAGTCATLPAFSFPQAPLPAVTVVESVPESVPAETQEDNDKQMRYDEHDKPEEAQREDMKERAVAPRGSNIADGLDSSLGSPVSVSYPTTTTLPVRRRLPHSSLPVFSFPQAPAPATEKDDNESGLKERCFSDDTISYTCAPISPFDMPSRSHALSRSQSHFGRNRRQPSVPLPAFSFPQAPASDSEFEPETRYDVHESDDYSALSFVSTSISNPLSSAVITEAPAAPLLFSSVDCNITPPPTGYSTASSNISPCTSPQPTHKRHSSRRHQHTSSMCMSQLPPQMRPIVSPPSAITPVTSPRVSAARCHPHRRSAAMSGIDGDAAAALAGISSGTTSPVSVTSRPGSAATVNIPQIILNGATPVSATATAGDEVLATANNEGSPSPLPVQWNAAQGASFSPLSTISSESSVTFSTYAADSPTPSPPSPPAQHVRPRTAGSAEILVVEAGDSSDRDVSQSQMRSHRRAHSTTLERSESESTQRTIKADDRRLNSTDCLRDRSVSKSKAAKKQKKDRPWAGILTRKSKKKQVAGIRKQQQQQSLESSQSQSQSQQPAHKTKQDSYPTTPATTAQVSSSDYPPPSSVITSEPTLTRDNSISDDSSDIDINFDDDHTIVIQSSDGPDEYNPTVSAAGTTTPTVSNFESAWKPRSFYEQGRQLNNEDNPFSPIIDFDAALGPFESPEVNESGSGFSYATKHMHSGRGRRNEFLSAENRHRRSESAPLTGPPSPEQVRNSPVAMAMPQYSAAAIFKTPDVFDEEEEDKFLAGTAEREGSKSGELGEDGDGDADEDSAEKNAGNEGRKSTNDDDDKKSIRSLKSLSGLRRPGSSRINRLPPGGRSLRIDTSRAISPYKVQRSEPRTFSSNEVENAVSPISIGRPLHACPPGRLSGASTALNNSISVVAATSEVVAQDLQIESPPELFTPTPKSQHTSIFSSPSTSTLSVAENSRSFSNFVPQDYHNGNDSSLFAKKEYTESPVEYSGTPPPSLPFATTTTTFDLSYAPSPSSSSTFCSSAMTSRHSQSRFLPATGTSTPTSATGSIDLRGSITNESISMSGSPSLPSPILRPGGRSRHKRSSIVSLSKLITASHATERNRASLDGRLLLSSVGSTSPNCAAGGGGGGGGDSGAGLADENDGVAGANRRVSCDTYRTHRERREAGLPTAIAASAATQPKSHRISRLMQFWRTRDKDGFGHA